MLIFSDVDGVAADFIKGALCVHGHLKYRVTQFDWFTKDWGLTPEEFWKPIKRKGKRFYRDFVPAFWWLSEYLDLLKQYSHDIVLATDNPNDADLMAGKIEWIEQHMPGYDIVLTVRGPRNNGKELLAAPGRVLIDDADHNVAKWRATGGDAILFPQLWNENRLHIAHQLDYVRHELDKIVLSNHYTYLTRGEIHNA